MLDDASFPLNMLPRVEHHFLSYDATHAERWTSWLSQAERACLESFGHPKRKQEFITGRAALRLLLADQLDATPVEMALRTAADGAVEAPGSGFAVSLAHSDNHAVAVAATHPIGVDLERIQPRRDDLYRFLLHPDEYEVLEALPMDRDKVHVLCWTIKEATLKGLRTGFRLSPKKLRLDIDLERGEALVDVRQKGTWRVRFKECRRGQDAAAYFWSIAVPSTLGCRPPLSYASSLKERNARQTQ